MLSTPRPLTMCSAGLTWQHRAGKQYLHMCLTCRLCTKSGGKHRCVTEPDTVSMVTYRVFSDSGQRKVCFSRIFLA